MEPEDFYDPVFVLHHFNGVDDTVLGLFSNREALMNYQNYMCNKYPSYHAIDMSVTVHKIVDKWDYDEYFTD